MLLARPFNRTSMESKPRCLQRYPICLPTLLIEPVWNRNGEARVMSSAASRLLLIEPVWNRNACRTQNRMGRSLQLLIEPVWNRNATTGGISAQLRHGTFNRTSMESKLYFCYLQFPLSIAFNRTSMESKLALCYLNE